MSAVFQLDHPLYGQTHGRIFDRYQNFSDGICTIVYEVGRVVAGEFQVAEGITRISKRLSPADMEELYDFAESKGQPQDQRGQVRDSDFGAWISGGNGI